MKSIWLTGSLSRTRNRPFVHNAGLSLSHIASSIVSSIWSNRGTCWIMTIINTTNDHFNQNLKKCSKLITFRTRSKHRWRLISRRRSIGSPWRIASSSTPLVANHLYWSYFLMESLNSGGSCLWCIHCSVSFLLTLHSSRRMVVAWRYLCHNAWYQYIL